MLGNFSILEPLKSKSPSIIKFSGNSFMSDPLKFKANYLDEFQK
jgi:hypothetical protein